MNEPWDDNLHKYKIPFIGYLAVKMNSKLDYVQYKVIFRHPVKFK